MLAIFSLIFLVPATSGYHINDEIEALPGLKVQPKFRQYSGYLNATERRYLHYWFVESQSYSETDPLVLWLNGGPGCSSMLGLLTENGPYTVQEGGKRLEYSPTSWNLNANILYLESPAGVGYSYSSDGNITTDDDEVTNQNFNALMHFFIKFPQFKGHKFYVMGESYGGFYVPLLANQLIHVPFLNFQGFAVGNPISNKKMNSNSLVYYTYHHGMFGERLWKEALNVCCKNNATMCDFVGSTDERCLKVHGEVVKAIWPRGIDWYNIYDTCGNPPVLYDDSLNRYVVRSFLYDPTFYFTTTPYLLELKEKIQIYVDKLPPDQVIGSLACHVDANMMSYMNSPDVRTALHIHRDLPSWSSCNIYIEKHFKKLYVDMTPMYQQFLHSGKRRVLIYDGDFDTMCNFMGNEWFINRLGRPSTEERRPWYYKESDGRTQLGGWTKSFDRAVFATVRGSGHMVPTDKPFAAFHIFQRFLNNRPL